MPDIFLNEPHKSKALITAYVEQIRYLRYLSQIDLRVFSGSITVQIVLAGWLSSVKSTGYPFKVIFIVLDLCLVLSAVLLLGRNANRRKIEVAKLSKILEALEFTKDGWYLPAGSLLDPPVVRSSLTLYWLVLFASFLGVAAILVFAVGN